MAEFKNVMSEFARMCKLNTTCYGCPIQGAKDELNMSDVGCLFFIGTCPEKIEELTMEWAEKHPVMTNRKKFEEVFGKDLIKLGNEESWGDIVRWLKEEYKGSDDND